LGAFFAPNAVEGPAVAFRQPVNPVPCLQNFYVPPIPVLRQWSSSEIELPGLSGARCAPEGGKDSPMSINYRDLILILVAGFAEAFLLWALWNFIKSSRRRPATGGSWRLNEGQKTRHPARPLQDLAAAAYSKPAANSEKVRSIRTQLTSAR